MQTGCSTVVAAPAEGVVGDLYVGTYRGIVPLRRQADERSWRLGAQVEPQRRASFGCYDPWRGVHYLVDERASGSVASFTPNGEGWQLQSSAATLGAMPCFVSLDRAASALAVANYESGSIALFPLCEATGAILNRPTLRCWSGHGPVKERQKGPHAHCVRFNHAFLYWTDLGSDRVLGCRYEPGVGMGVGLVGEPFVAFAAPRGEGPRHIAFHPTLPRAYLLSELGSHVFVLEIAQDGRLTEVERTSTLPAGWRGESLGGHLALAGDAGRLHVSNRGHDSIAAFAVDQDGGLKLEQIAPTGAQSPRHFRFIEGQFVIVAHEEGDSVVVIDIAQDGSIGEPVQTLAVDKPAFIGERYLPN